MSQDSNDLTDFDKSLCGLFTLLKNVIKTHEKNNLNLLGNRKNPIMTRLQRYIKVYDITEPEEHLWYFRKLFSDNKGPILRGPGRDGWLRSQNIVIHYGVETGHPIRDAKIHLSAIYTTACNLRDEAEQNMVGLPGADQSQELLYPSIFLLFLYSVFHEIASEDSDKEKLSEYIVELEKEAGIKKKSKKSSKVDSNDPLGGILSAATDMAAQMGIQLPEGQKMPSGNELTSALNGVMQNPQTKSMLGNVMQELQECNNVGDLVTKLMGGLSSAGIDPAAQQTLKDNLSAALPTEEYEEGEEEFIDDDEFYDGDEFLDESN